VLISHNAHYYIDKENDLDRTKEKAKAEEMHIHDIDNGDSLTCKSGVPISTIL
jgi:hypothetical protein